MLKLLCIAAIIAAVASCNLKKENVNPNVTTEAPLSAVLTGAEASIGFVLGSEVNPITNIFVQQFAGANGDAAAYQNYTEASGRYNIIWNDMYGIPLKNLSILINKSRANGSPYYTGISRILLAFSYGTLTDIFGDIPYSEALQGTGNLAPKYDGQEKVYIAIQAQLDSAIADLSVPKANISTPLPGSDDIIFGGNTAKWIAAAWTLKARYALHLSKIDPAGSATKALTYLANGITSNQGDAQVNFGVSSTNANPYYQISTFRPGWLGLDAAFVNLLNGNQTTDPGTKAPTAGRIDPRRPYYATTTTTTGTNYQGFRLGESGAISYIGPYFASPTSPVILVTYAEAKFIEAEARLRLNASDPAIQTALEAGIHASFNKVVNAADTNATPARRAAYIAATSTLTGNFDADLEKIITQKYLALFTQSEVWTDYRRTGYPVLLPPLGGANSSNPGGKVPRRGLYPASEQQLNPNIPTLKSNHETPRLWWDQ